MLMCMNGEGDTQGPLIMDGTDEHSVPPAHNQGKYAGFSVLHYSHTCIPVVIYYPGAHHCTSTLLLYHTTPVLITPTILPNPSV